MEIIKIILIAGKAGSGKTYLGKQIAKEAEKKGLSVLQTEYSKYIKMYAKEIIGYNGDPKNKPRKFLQDVGSFIRDSLEDPHFFTRRMLEDFRIYEKIYDMVIISDVRLKREIEDIKASKYKEITTVYAKTKFYDYPLSKEEKKHITETELENDSNFDFLFTEENKEKIETFIEKILEGER